MTPVGRYRPVEEVGRGAAGSVWRAFDPGGDQVALKLLIAGRDADPLQRSRFASEVRTLVRLRHPGVVAILDAGEHEGTPWLAMEWVEGETLAARLEREGPLQAVPAARIAWKLTQALEHCHAQGVLHRDLKPENVLLRARSGEPLLSDFGLAKDLLREDSLTGSSKLGRSIRGRWMGTPGFWPPEQARGELERLGPASDVYGLCALLFAMLTGRPPQRGESLVELVASFEREPEQPGSTAPFPVPVWLDDLVVRGLHPDPERRPPSAASLARELQAGLSGRPARWGRSWHGAAALLLLVLGGVAASMVFALDRSGEVRAELAALEGGLASSGDPAGALAALERIEARARALDEVELLRQVDALRSAARLLASADELLRAAEPSRQATAELPTLLRARSTGSGDRWQRAAELIEALAALEQVAAACDAVRPVEELARLSAAVSPDAAADLRLASRAERVRARVAAHQLLDQARRLAGEGASRPLVLARFERALEQVRADPQVSELLRQARARYYLQCGMLEDALREGLALAPRPGRVGGEGRLTADVALFWQGWLLEAIRDLDRLSKLEPDTVPGLKAAAAVSLVYPTRVVDGEDRARRALLLDPDDLEAAVLAAQCAAHTGKAERAVTELEGLIARAPTSTAAWIALMVSRDIAGNAQGSRSAAEQAIALVAPNPAGFVWMQRGLIRMLRGMSGDRALVEGALEDFQRAEQLEPDAIVPRFYRLTLSATKDLQAVLAGDPRAMQPLRELHEARPAETQRCIDNLLDQRLQAGFQMFLKPRVR